MPLTHSRPLEDPRYPLPRYMVGDEGEVVNPNDEGALEDLFDSEEEEEEDELFGEPPGSDLNDPADDDW